MRPTPASLLKLLVPIKPLAPLSSPTHSPLAAQTDSPSSLLVPEPLLRDRFVLTSPPCSVFEINRPRSTPAVEEAVRLRERHKASITSIIVCTIGPPKALDVLRTALAMGADSAIHIEVPDGTIVEPLSVARLLQAVISTESPDLVILGKQAIDDDASQVGGMLAGMLGWPQANFASKIELSGEGLKDVKVAREIDGGLETLEMKCPAVVTTDLRLNEPRYASLPNIMKAKKKPIKKMKPEDLKIDISPRLETLNVSAPPARQGGAKVETIDEVVAKLKEAGVL
ncbi:electron transfer flavoprotein beta subunit, partial [Phenoliferia sp. Uapishka_3]